MNASAHIEAIKRRGNFQMFYIPIENRCLYFIE